MKRILIFFYFRLRALNLRMRKRMRRKRMRMKKMMMRRSLKRLLRLTPSVDPPLQSAPLPPRTPQSVLHPQPPRTDLDQPPQPPRTDLDQPPLRGKAAMAPRPTTNVRPRCLLNPPNLSLLRIPRLYLLVLVKPRILPRFTLRLFILTHPTVLIQKR